MDTKPMSISNEVVNPGHWRDYINAMILGKCADEGTIETATRGGYLVGKDTGEKEDVHYNK